MRVSPATREQQTEILFLEGILRRLPGRMPILRALADLYTATGRIEEGFRLDRQLTELDPADGTAWYNLACSLALLARPEQALDALREALRQGYDDAAWMRKDPDLASLRELPAFREFLASTPIAPEKTAAEDDGG